MVGTTVDGQLKPLRVDERGRFAVATREDDAALRHLLRATPLPGAVSVTFEREPDFFRGAGLLGAEEQTIVARDAGRLLCAGRCVTRPCWVNGELRRVGYLAELRLHADARGRLELLRGGYRFFHAAQRAHPAALYFTSIAADNLRARGLLERGVAGLPRYGFLGGLTTLLVPAGGGAAAPELGGAEPEEIAAFLAARGRERQLAAAWTPADLAGLAAHGLAGRDLRVARRGGSIVAVAGLWDQRSFRQVVIRGYAPALRLARPWVNALHALAGTGRLPACGATLAHAFVAPFAWTEGAEAAAVELIAALRADAAARGLEFLTLGLPTDHPLLGALRRRFHGRAYDTRLYQVAWPDQPAIALDARPILPEVALL